jgi:hypothetical protein
MDLQEVCKEGNDWIDLIQDRNQAGELLRMQ